MKVRIILCLLAIFVAFLPAVMNTQPALAAEYETVYSDKDNYIDELYPTTNYGSSTSFKAGMPVDTYSVRGLLEFSITWGTTIPADAVITAATLYMRYSGHGAADPVGRTIRVQRMLRLSWSETLSNWQRYKSGYYWGTEGCGSSSTDYTTSGQASATVPSSYGWMTWNILTQVQFAQTNNQDVAIRVVDSSEVFGYFTNFATREGSTYDPYILIAYITPPEVATDTASSVLDTTATLGGTITDIGSSSVTTRGFKYGLTQTPTWDVHEDGSFGTGDYSLGATSLTPGTGYWFRAYATNGAGTAYGSWVAFSTKDDPTITTVAASSVAGTSARLNSALESDGNDPCTIKFGWGLTSQSHVEDYDTYYTLPGTYESGSYPYLDVIDLVAGYTYYFRVSATNVIGTTEGSQLSFETPIILSPPTNLIGYPGSTSISLSWTKGIGATNTMLRYGTTTYPASVVTGIEAYFGTGSTYTVDDLTSGKTYYFSAWGESGGNYSASHSTFMMTTSAAGPGTVPDMDVPTQPSRWFSAPDYTTMDGLILIYDAINDAADSGEIPRETAWFLLALGLSFLAGLIAYLALGKKMMIAMIVMTVCFAFGYFVKLIPWWVPLMSLILVIALSQTHKQVAEG